MSEDTVTYAVEGNVASVSLNRPESHNALSDEMFELVVAGLVRAAADDDVKCVILRGNGKSFSSGFDLSNPDDFFKTRC